MEKRELVIVGAGPAGLTAAIYGKRAGLDVLLLENATPGGQINNTNEIENWPGEKHSGGLELGTKIKEHAEHLKAEIRDDKVVRVEVRNGTKVVVTEKDEIEADAVILATGSSFRKLGCKGEAEKTGAGVSYCAVCDGAFFQDETIAVVGGGNVAVEEALYLTRFAKKVYIIHRREEFRADKMAVDRALSNPKIEPIWNSVVESIEGDGLVDKILVKNVKSGEISNIEVAGVFVFVGTVPNVDCLGVNSSILNQTEDGWITTNEKMESSTEGLFAAGDVREKTLRQVITAASDGAIAAMSAHSYITEQLHLENILFEPEHVFALISSSIDQRQVELQLETENYSKASGNKISFIDGYKNKRIVEKLKISALPSLVELKKGKLIRSIEPKEIAAVKFFIE